MAKILIVDDSRTVVAVVSRVLRERGYECVEAFDGESGFITAKMHRPDLVLMDVVMGEHNGFQTCRRIKRDSETAHIPVVIMSGKNSETDIYWGKKNGASEYLHKPVSPDHLIQTVERLLN